ncbi:hypothetical protein FRC03_004544 [Tulasnella sp. 419]|nr:hypothetical protein FRC02_007489 [Tulasnella sp. 418]KAG8941433.1 hypothetical protein FRC03_004544 [Tulasnella sp. 419]
MHKPFNTLFVGKITRLSSSADKGRLTGINTYPSQQIQSRCVNLGPPALDVCQPSRLDLGKELAHGVQVTKKIRLSGAPFAVQDDAFNVTPGVSLNRQGEDPPDSNYLREIVQLGRAYW